MAFSNNYYNINNTTISRGGGGGGLSNARLASLLETKYLGASALSASVLVYKIRGPLLDPPLIFCKWFEPSSHVINR